MHAIVSVGLQCLLAQTAVDPISGGAGWVGAGLLGAVLAWLLLKYLPEQDRQRRDLIDNYAQRFDARDMRHQIVLDKISDEYRRSLDKVVEHCKEEGRTAARDISMIVEAQQEMSEILSRIWAKDARITGKPPGLTL